jgi:putative transposase
MQHKPTLLSDNGSGYLLRPFNEYLELMQIKHLFTARLHPQTIGKFEGLNRTAKAKLGLVIYTSLEELERAVARFQRWYNHERYHESIANLRPAEVYEGRAEDILCDCEAVAGRKELKRQTLRARREHNLGVSHQQERSGQTGREVHLTSSPAVSERI